MMTDSSMIDLGRLVESANEMAPLPASTVRLAQLVSQPGSHLDDVVELIAFDQALTVKLLRSANAAGSGACAIATVNDAVLRLGTAQVLALAVAGSAKSLMSARLVEYGLDEGALWRHSVAAAVAAEMAPNYCRVEAPRETFTAALLHDVGKLVMARSLSPEILDFIHRAQEVDGMGRLDAESLLLGANHAELGGLVAQHWGLPARVVQGIIYHHHPEQGTDIIGCFTYLANHMAKQLEASLAGKKTQLELSPEVRERLGLTPDSITAYSNSVATRFEKVSRRYHAV